MRKSYDIAKKTGLNAGGVRMLASQSGVVFSGVRAAFAGALPCNHRGLHS